LLVLSVANVHSAAGSVKPSVAHYVSAHASAPSRFPLAAAGANESVARSYNVPDHLAGSYQLVGEQDDDGRKQLVYSDGSQIFSMFLQAGRLDVRALPVDAQPVQMDGVPAWLVPTADGDVVFVQRARVVVVIVGMAPPAATSEVANAPAPSTGSLSMLDRVEAAGRGLLETFGLQG
jgi:hypothetical protein